MNILVVDDDTLIRDTVVKYGRRDGFEVDQAANGFEAIELCEHKVYDMILLDIMLLAGAMKITFSSGAVIDATEGSAVTSGSAMAIRHRYIVAEDTSAAFTVTSKTAVADYQGYYAFTYSDAVDYNAIAAALKQLSLFKGSYTGYGQGYDLEVAPTRIQALIMGSADNLKFSYRNNAWARLYNPPGSGVNLFVNVWTVTSGLDGPYCAQFWFNGTPPGNSSVSRQVTTTNLALCPPAIPKVKLEYASGVCGEPEEGIKAFVRNGDGASTLVDTENGKLIFPPGGSFLILLSVSDHAQIGLGRIAFGWWEE